MYKSFIKICLTSSFLLIAANSMCFAEPALPKGAVDVKIATAMLHPTEGNNVQGTVTFTKAPNGVRIVAVVRNLEPGKHGFHIHEHGDCSAHDASSAGGHFNPTGKKHGGPDNPERHVGDMGNLEADENGIAHYDRIDELMTLTGKDSIIGRSVVVHAGEDDLHTQPTGNSGARIACGVIQ